MTSGAAPERVTIAEAARLSALFAVSTGLVLAGGILFVAVGDYGGLTTRAPQFAEFFVSWPLWALLLSGIALFGLTVHRSLSGWWDFAWRGAVAAYLGITVAASAYLVTVEVIGDQPGAAGGFFLVIASALGFTVIGGPVLAGLLSVLWRPRRLSANHAQRSEPERMDARRRLGYVLLFAGATVCLGTLASTGLASQSRATYECMVAGPVPTGPLLAVVSEAPNNVRGSFSFWPLGRQCEWDRADGRGTIITNSEAWGTTTFAGISGLLALLGGGVVLGSPRNGKYTRKPDSARLAVADVRCQR